MISPYYLVFYKIYRWLKRLNIKDEDIGFSSFSILCLIFIPHFFITLILLGLNGIVDFQINIDKHLFGILFVGSFYIMNYLLFDRDSRFKKVVNRIETSSKYKFIGAYIILLGYFCFPIVLGIIYWF